MPVSNKIQEIRLGKNWNRGEMSRRSGIKAHTLWGIETHQRDTSISRAFRIAKAFNLKVEDIFTYEEAK